MQHAPSGRPVSFQYASATTDNADRWAVAFAWILPTIVTLGYFVVLAGWPTAVQQAAYGIGKTLQFAFPLFWVLWMQRHRLQRTRPRRADFIYGLGSGLAIFAATLALYALVLKPAGFFDGPDEAVRAKITDLGLSSPIRMIATGVFYALCHSLLEEYYWRWFVFGQLRRQTGFGWAVAISSVGFMAHHILLIATYLGWTSPATYLFSAAVAIGGAIWAWMYQQSGTLYGAWISHLLVDAAIFIIGYDLARAAFT